MPAPITLMGAGFVPGSSHQERITFALVDFSPSLEMPPHTPMHLLRHPSCPNGAWPADDKPTFGPFETIFQDMQACSCLFISKKNGLSQALS